MITVQVTEQDIERGVPRSGAYCPIARALSREVGKFTFVLENPRSII